MQTFITDKEFEQAAVNLVARFIADFASETIALGIQADVGEQSLAYLSQVAASKELNLSTINVYFEMIADENKQIDDFYTDNKF